MASRIRVTVWNEFRRERRSAEIGAVARDGIHGAIAAAVYGEAP